MNDTVLIRERDGAAASAAAFAQVRGHPPVAQAKVGVLVVNLGSPSLATRVSVRDYLAEFLSDPRVIEAPRAVWLPILYGYILNLRPRRVAKAYQRVWNNDANESWLITHSRNQALALYGRLNSQGPAAIVDWAMRYGQPSIKSRVLALKEQGCERILVFPLYPQYSATTTATVNDKVFETLRGMRWQPAVRTVPPYYDEPAYIEALARSIEGELKTLKERPEVILASFHGIPQSYFRKGDPYYCHCMKTARLLREALGLAPDQFMATFQSRFGPEKWLEPYTDKTVVALARRGVKRLAIVNPGFASDCLETLEEIAVGVKEQFLEHGGQSFHHISCLNAGEPGLDMLEALTRRELKGWI